MSRWGLMLTGLLLAGCASQSPTLPAAPLAPEQLLAPPQLPADLPAASDSSDWLEVDADMQRFVARLELLGNRRARIRQLIEAVHHQHPQRFSYRLDGTLTAPEAFARREGNCMAFSAMMIALLRHAGLTAQFQRVEVVPEWNLWSEDTSVAGQHINTRVRLRKGPDLVVDWGGTDGMARDIRLISDREARAEYHNNLAVSAMLDDNHPQAFADLRQALELAPDLAHLWSNLAVLYQREGNAEAAESAWHRALALDADQVMAMGGLIGLYGSSGREPAADALQHALERHRRQDPFYHYLRARQAFDQGDLDAASMRVRQALALKRHDRFIDLRNQIRARRNADA